MDLLTTCLPTWYFSKNIRKGLFSVGIGYRLEAARFDFIRIFSTLIHLE